MPDDVWNAPQGPMAVPEALRDSRLGEEVRVRLAKDGVEMLFGMFGFGEAGLGEAVANVWMPPARFKVFVAQCQWVLDQHKGTIF
jgi:hypothetical protein